MMRPFHSITVTGDADGRVITTIDFVKPEIRITAHVARRLLREVVAEAGRDHVSRAPGLYVHAGLPECIVAYALIRLGLTVEELSDMDADSTLSEITKVRLPMRVRMSTSARRVLQAAQSVQDVEDPWSVALDTALAVRPWRVAA